MELAWRLPQGAINVDSWVSSYVTRRYGSIQSDTAAAWKLLQYNPYNCTAPGQTNPSSFIALRPYIQPPPATTLCYNTSVIPGVLAHLIAAATASPTVASQATFSHDIAAVTRQMLSNLFLTFFSNLMTSYNAKNQNGTYWLIKQTQNLYTL